MKISLFKIKLHWQIAMAMGLGIVIGFVFQTPNQNAPSSFVYSFIISMGTVFIRLLKMVIVPLILSSIISGISSIGGSGRLGRLGLKTISYYLITSFLAILIGLILTNLIKPGKNTTLPLNEAFNPENIQSTSSLGEIIIRMIPENPFQAASNADMLGIIFFSVLFGIALTKTPPVVQSNLNSFITAAFETMMKLTEMIIKLAPFGVIGLMTKAVSSSGFSIFQALGKYMVTIVLGLSIHFFLILPLIFFLLTRINPLVHYKAMGLALTTAFSTSSSNATLPLTIRNIEKNAGVSNKISSFVLPLGATINMDGTALYECAGVIFISQVLGIELTFMQQLVTVFTALLASVGAAGIPSAGLVVIFIVTKAVGLQDDSVALIIGAMLAVDRPLDMFRTMVNVCSDTIGAVIVAKSEGEKNLYPNTEK
jgi:Na+/H+-dicarboxylate symporter